MLSLLDSRGVQHQAISRRSRARAAGESLVARCRIRGEIAVSGRDDEGASAVEYGLLVVAVLAVIALMVMALRSAY